MEYVNCDLCGSNDTELQYSKPDDWLKNYETEYSVVKCKNCDLVYVNPRPTYEGMRDFILTVIIQIEMIKPIMIVI